MQPPLHLIKDTIRAYELNTLQLPFSSSYGLSLPVIHGLNGNKELIVTNICKVLLFKTDKSDIQNYYVVHFRERQGIIKMALLKIPVIFITVALIE